jgi:hypothetical protein
VAFKKGQGGRPSGAKNRTNQTVGVSLASLGGPDGEKYAQQLFTIACAKHDDVHARLKALSIIAPYVWGKPKESIDITGDVNLRTTVVHEYHPD